MLRTIKEDSSILRLETILKSRYGKGFVLRQMVDLKQVHEWQAQGNEFAMIRGDLHIPLRKNDHVLGTVIVRDASELNSDSQRDIVELVRMMLSPQLSLWHHEASLLNQSLMAHSHNANGAHGASALQSEPAKHSSKDDERWKTVGDLSKVEIHDGSSEKLPRFITQLIHLQSQSANFIQRAAMQVHELSGRWAMIPFHDVAKQVSSIEDLKQIGSVTLYSQDILALTNSEQALIIEYLDSSPASDDPLILLGSNLSAAEIVDCAKLYDSLKGDLVGCSLELDRMDLRKSNLREVVEMMFMESSDRLLF